MDRNYFFSVCEAIFFASSEPLTENMIKQAFGEEVPGDFDRYFQEFLQFTNVHSRGIQIIRIAGGFQCVTRSEFAPYIRRINTQKQKVRLSRAALETLAIVAYKQPVTCPEIEHIRGVDSSGVIKNLIEKELIAILGRRKVPGMPILYGTTKKFLIEFGLESIEDLPTMQEFEKLFEDETLTPELPFNSRHPSMKHEVDAHEKTSG